MKTVKRIFAIAVAVLLIAMMIPTAFAASNTISWTCTFKGYTYTVYKVADYNSTTGAFTALDDSLQYDVDNAVTKAQMASLAESLEDYSFLNEDVVAGFSTDDGSGTVSIEDGIYFVKCTQRGPNNKAILMDSIVVFPNANDTTTESINLSSKINEGQPTVDKKFKVGSTLTAEDQTYGTVDLSAKSKTITYVLTADVAGSVTSKLTSYVITDKMGTGLKTSKHDVKSVVLKNGTTETALDYTVSTDASVIDCATTVDGGVGTTGNTFGVSIAAAELAKDSFYTEGNQVVVTFETELDYATAVVATLIPNSDALIYGNDSGRNVVPGPTVNAKTYQPYAQKLDANTNQPIAGKSATFGLYEDEACKKEITTAESDPQTGIADFQVKLPAGTYYIKETVAPAGYNLNSEVKAVTLGGTTGTATVTIKDTPSKLPSTGGNGTMIFTIVGGSLVLLAAALFVVVMKKRSSAK